FAPASIRASAASLNSRLKRRPDLSAISPPSLENCPPFYRLILGVHSSIVSPKLGAPASEAANPEMHASAPRMGRRGAASVDRLALASAALPFLDCCVDATPDHGSSGIAFIEERGDTLSSAERGALSVQIDQGFCRTPNVDVESNHAQNSRALSFSLAAPALRLQAVI